MKKRFPTYMLVVVLLISLVGTVASAAMSTPSEIELNSASYVKLTHKNVQKYMMYSPNPTDPNPSCQEKPLPNSLAGEKTWYIGTTAYDRDDCCFIMGGSCAASYEEQVPAYVQWDVSVGYQYFRCEVGAGMWGHSGGTGYRFAVSEVLKSGNENMLLISETFLYKEDEPMQITVKLSENAKAVKVLLYLEEPDWSSTSCVIANAYAYNVYDEEDIKPGMSIPSVVMPEEALTAVSEITEKADSYKQLYHGNVKSYMMYAEAPMSSTPKCHEKPLPDSLAGEAHWSIGSVSYPRDHCTFIMASQEADSGEEQVPSYLAWDTTGYRYFRCEVGAGMWGHSGGDSYLFSVSVVDASRAESVLARSGVFQKKGEDPITIFAVLPEGASVVKVRMRTENGGIGSTSCVVADAYLYNTSIEYAPKTGVLYGVDQVLQGGQMGESLTLAPQNTKAPEPTQTEKETAPVFNLPETVGGCGGSIALGALVFAAAAAAPFALRKKRGGK